MSKYIRRLLSIDKNYFSFLWSAKRTEKSFWIKHNFSPDDIMLIYLLQTDVFRNALSRLI